MLGLNSLKKFSHIRFGLFLILAASAAFHSPHFAFAQTETDSKESIRSEHLSSKVKDPYVQSSEEDMGIVLYGRMEGQGSEFKKLGVISTHYTESDTEVIIEEVRTESDARGLGVATALYEYVIKSSESYSGKRVTRLSGTSKVGSNRDAIVSKYIELLSEKPGFEKPDPSLGVQEQFVECCSKIYEQHTDLLPEAVANSPTAKIGKKLGFKVDPSSIEFSIGDLDGKVSIHINYVQNR